MPAETQKVVFARINRRRQDGQETLTGTSFRQDMLRLARSHQTRALQEQVRERPPRTWFAGDMNVDGNFLTGTLGYTTPDQHLTFDDEAWSWIKARPHESDTARQSTISPFAIDLREHDRWVAFAPTSRLRNKAFAEGLERVLGSASLAEGEMPSEWDVDMVVSQERIDEWLRLHPLVYRLNRTIKFTNPGRDLDDDRQEMKALGARRKTEYFAASKRGILDVTSDRFHNKLNGLETGDVEVRLESRNKEGRGHSVFNSVDSPDEMTIDSFGGDFLLGMDAIISALRQYVASKSAPPETA